MLRLSLDYFMKICKKTKTPVINRVRNNKYVYFFINQVHGNEINIASISVTVVLYYRSQIEMTRRRIFVIIYLTTVKIIIQSDGHFTLREVTNSLLNFRKVSFKRFDLTEVRNNKFGGQ